MRPDTDRLRFGTGGRAKVSNVGVVTPGRIVVTGLKPNKRVVSTGHVEIACVGPNESVGAACCVQSAGLAPDECVVIPGHIGEKGCPRRL